MRVNSQRLAGIAGSVFVFAVATLWYSAHAADVDLVGRWQCPTQLRLGVAGQSDLAMKVNTRSILRADGGFNTDGDAIVNFGPWPLVLAGTSRGQWRRDRQQLTLTLETLELAPGSAQAVELQRYLIQQLVPMLPQMPHTETATILRESGSELLLEDEFGEQFSCIRLSIEGPKKTI